MAFLAVDILLMERNQVLWGRPVEPGIDIALFFVVVRYSETPVALTSLHLSTWLPVGCEGENTIFLQQRRTTDKVISSRKT